VVLDACIIVDCTGTAKGCDNRNTAKFGTVAVLVHWPRENVDIYIFTPSAMLILSNTAEKLKLPTSCSLPYFGGKIPSKYSPQIFFH